MDLLQMLPNLHELTFRNISRKAACDQPAASLFDSLSSEHPWSGYLCPELQDVTLVNVSVKSRTAGNGANPTTEDIVARPYPGEDANVRESLRAFVIYRSRIKATLARLDISE
ncbi:hypothetical protein BD410DRAFT_203448 [Rickenella mellea]|uniref:Uncharacterized protein n=1 Tax=Rickenella mellea TaxID=50990 RepID=A0A4Y7PHI0_9AGAM|nr:hypothetical protein BD410DRAFT_203448 [Rickenella mellea]